MRASKSSGSISTSPRSTRSSVAKSYISHLPADMFAASIKDGRFRATADFADLREADAILICVPTPLTAHREPDLSFVEATARSILPNLRPGQLVILESTSYPGTTREVIIPILEELQFKSGTDFYIAFSPEREDPGNIEFSTSRFSEGRRRRRRCRVKSGGCSLQRFRHPNRSRSQPRDGGSGEDHRKHLSLGQHRARQRA